MLVSTTQSGKRGVSPGIRLIRRNPPNVTQIEKKMRFPFPGYQLLCWGLKLQLMVWSCRADLFVNLVLLHTWAGAGAQGSMEKNISERGRKPCSVGGKTELPTRAETHLKLSSFPPSQQEPAPSPPTSAQSGINLTERPVQMFPLFQQLICQDR